MNHDLVILVSGGYDSVLLLNMALKMEYKPIALLIDYGQKHKRELEVAFQRCSELNVPYRRMEVKLDGVNSGLTGSLEAGTFRGVHEMHVPGRNTIFVGLAVSLAESVRADKIWYGANQDDRINEFPDCFQEWIVEMNQSLRRAGSYPIELEAPLLGMRKETIFRLGMAYHNLKMDDTHSGYAV